MKVDPTIRKGVCLNVGNCPNANEKKVIELGIGEEFVCPNPECGGMLKEVKPKTGIPMWIIIVIAVVVIGGAGVGYFFLKPNITPPPINGSTGGNKGDTTVVIKTKSSNENENQPVVSITDGDSTTGNGKGSISFQHGKYVGEIKGFKANGQGSLQFFKEHRLSTHDKQNRMAASGDVISGTFKDNEMVNGKWYDKDQNQKGVLLTGELGH